MNTDMKKKDYGRIATELVAYLQRKGISHEFEVKVATRNGVVDDKEESIPSGIDLISKRGMTIVSTSEIVDFARTWDLLDFVCMVHIPTENGSLTEVLEWCLI